jgi:adenosine/AMP kinase
VPVFWRWLAGEGHDAAVHRDGDAGGVGEQDLGQQLTAFLGDLGVGAQAVEDLHEALAGASPRLRFGLAFCEASAARLVRRSGNDDELVGLATENARRIGAGHSFVVLLRDGFPVNVMNQVKAVPEVCTIFCATANPVAVIVVVTGKGRGIAGVIDGSPPVGVETDADVATRHSLLRELGYKL